MELALSNFIIDINTKTSKPQKQKKKNDFLSIADTNNLIKEISHLRKEPSENRIFEIIKRIFSTLNIQHTSISNSPNEKGVDLIIRNKGLAPYFGNPMLIEIKAGVLNTSILNNAQYQLQNYLFRTEAKGGIILYLDKNDKRFSISSKYPLILCFDIEDFVLGISSQGLEKFLIQKRNEIAHGIWQ